jgi:fructose-1,6-bisphosphatase
VASEEEEIEKQLHVGNIEEDGTKSSGEFSVAFDPLDGSSLVDVNFSVGTIIGIYPRGSFIGKKSSQIHVAVVAVYGPRTTLFVAVKGKGTHQYLLTSGGFVLQQEHLHVADEGKYFAPGNLRACLKSPSYRKLVNFWLDEQYTLRYSGGMVPDINHILVKGSGVFTYPGYSDEPSGKLRLLYECGTMAFLLAEAGGVASDGVIDLLDKPVEHLDQRTPIFIGSKKEVEKALQFFS